MARPPRDHSQARHTRPRRATLGLVALLCAGTSGGASVVAGPPAPERRDHDAAAAEAARRRADLLLRLVRFTRWPQVADDAGDRNIAIAVIEDDHFADALARVCNDVVLDKRAVEVDSLAWPVDKPTEGDAFRSFARVVGTYEVVLVPARHAEQVEALAMLVSRRPCLLIADSPDGIGLGAALALDVDGGGMDLHASRSALDVNPLRVDAQLLRLAELHD